MKINEDGKNLIKDFERCVLTAYPDPFSELARACRKAGVVIYSYEKFPNWEKLSGEPWTIGWGHTGKDVYPGLKWRQETADKAFAMDIEERALITRRLAKASKIGKIPENQFNALVSFVYNVNFLTARNLFRNCVVTGEDGMPKLCPEAVTRYLEGHAAASGVHVPGLARRRRQEIELFMKDAIA